MKFLTDPARIVGFRCTTGYAPWRVWAGPFIVSRNSPGLSLRPEVYRATGELSVSAFGISVGFVR